MAKSIENDFQPWPQQTSARVIFSRKIKKTSHPPLTTELQLNSVKHEQFQKPFGVFLEDKLDFREHLRNIFKKINRTISLLRKLQNNLPRALIGNNLYISYKAASRLQRHFLWPNVKFNIMHHLQQQALYEVV